MLEFVRCLSKSKSLYFALSLVFLIGLALANIANIYAVEYLPDGIANWGMVAAYAQNFMALLKTGGGSTNLLPFILTTLVLCLYIYKLKIANLSARPSYILTTVILLVGVFFNQTAKSIRVNKHGVLEDNSLIRVFKNEDKKRNLKDVLTLKNQSIDKKIVNKFQKEDYIYPSKEYPFIRYKNSQEDFPENPPNIVLIGLESVSYEEVFRDNTLTPFIKSMAQKSLNFESFYSHAGYTAGAQASLLCSVYDNLRADAPHFRS